MDLRDIQNLIKFVSKSGVNEVKLETKDLKISIKTSPDNDAIPMMTGMPQYIAAPQALQTAAVVETKESPSSVEDNAKYLTITSPMIGTIYRKPSPEKPYFVNVGDTISVGSVVCIIEAMKLFNEIESEVSGKIVKILVDDSTPVEFGQPLFLVDPS